MHHLRMLAPLLKKFKSQNGRGSIRLHFHVIHDVTMPCLNDAQRNNATGQLEAGETQIDMARYFDVSRQTICAL